MVEWDEKIYIQKKKNKVYKYILSSRYLLQQEWYMRVKKKRKYTCERGWKEKKME